ncbi:DUF2852 domain-containing protein [Acidisoma sp. C75]
MSGANQAYGGSTSPPWSQDERLWALWSISRPLLGAAAILGFILWWPIGFALLFLAIYNRRLGRIFFGGPRGAGGFCGGGGRSARWAAARSAWCGPAGRSSGNHAFDDYRAATLRRLEEEQEEFASFLDRLRFAKDKAEFDQFMAERRQRGSGAAPEEPQASPG